MHFDPCVTKILENTPDIVEIVIHISICNFLEFGLHVITFGLCIIFTSLICFIRKQMIIASKF